MVIIIITQHVQTLEEPMSILRLPATSMKRTLRSTPIAITGLCSALIRNYCFVLATLAGLAMSGI